MLVALPFPDISPALFSYDVPLWTFTLGGRDIALGGFELAIRWYALAYIVAILFARWVIKRIIQTPLRWPGGRATLTVEQLEDLMTWMIVGIVGGGRLGYVVFYKPYYYLADPWQIIRITDGGMSFHGGFLGVVIACILFCRKHKLPIAPIADLLAATAPMGLLLGRLANFINGELWGRETDVAWGVIFPGEYAQNCAQAFIGECARHPSQLYEALGEGLILGAILMWLLLRTSALKHAWTMTGVFLIGYGLTRFIVELFRQPDAHFQNINNPIGYAVPLGEYGLTMGQVLSIPMIVLGTFLAIRWAIK